MSQENGAKTFECCLHGGTYPGIGFCARDRDKFVIAAVVIIIAFGNMLVLQRAADYYVDHVNCRGKTSWLFPALFQGRWRYF